MQIQNTGVTSQYLGVVEKPPVLVKIISWILLLSGILYLVFIIYGFVLIKPDMSNLFSFIFGMSGINSIISIALIVSSFGIRYMRRWALYTILIVLVLNIVYSIYTLVTNPFFPASLYVLTIIDYLMFLLKLFIIVYLGIIYRRFR